MYNRFEVENIKRKLLKMTRDSDKIDLAKTPAFVFLQNLDNDLQAPEHRLSREVVAIILCNFTVDLAGLGTDAEPHRDWLNQISQAYASMIAKLYHTFEQELGHSPEKSAEMCSRGLHLKLS